MKRELGKEQACVTRHALDLPTYNTTENKMDYLKIMYTGERSGWSFECKIE